MSTHSESVHENNEGKNTLDYAPENENLVADILCNVDFYTSYKFTMLRSKRMIEELTESQNAYQEPEPKRMCFRCDYIVKK